MQPPDKTEITTPQFGWGVRATAFAILLGILGGMIYLTERVLQQRHPIAAVSSTNIYDPHYTPRTIKLKELQPSYSSETLPNDQYLTGTDGGPARKLYRIQTDSDGFIKPSKVHEKPDYSIFFVGGSTVECLFVDEKLRYPYLAGRLLEQRQKLRINSYNAGVSGNDSLHSINIILNKIVPYQPKYLVLMHNINDLVTMAYYGSYWNSSESRGNLRLIEPKEAPTTRFLLAEAFSTALPSISRGVRSLVMRDTPPVDEHAASRQERLHLDQKKIVKQFRANMLAFVALSRAYDIEPVLMTQFNRFESRDPFVLKQLEKAIPVDTEEFIIAYVALNEETRHVARDMNVQLIDLARLIPGNREFLYDAVHLNENGSRLVAKTIADTLK